MKRSILIVVALLFVSSTAFGEVYFVEVDGGTPAECNGLSIDAINEDGNCALNHIQWVNAPVGNNPTLLKGGDTLNMGSGEYEMGFNGPNHPDGSTCSTYYPWACGMRSIPSGTEENPTIINGDCSGNTQLWGSERLSTVFNLNKSEYVDVNCIEITDHESCGEGHPNRPCKRDQYPYGDWAKRGISMIDAKDINLYKVNVHGLAWEGIKAARVENIEVRGSNITANQNVGWEGDMGKRAVYDEDNNLSHYEIIDSSNSGYIKFIDTIFAWNGCLEGYPNVLLRDECRSQDYGGYGDGLGTGPTKGLWYFENVQFINNGSDGLDLLYHDGDGEIIIIGGLFANNAGNQIKVAAQTLIDGARVEGYCDFFADNPQFIMHQGFNPCRASGNSIAVRVRPGTTTIIKNSFISGNGDVLIESGGDDCNGDEKIFLIDSLYELGKEYHKRQYDEDTKLYYATGAKGNGDGPCGSVKLEIVNSTEIDSEDPELIDDDVAAADVGVLFIADGVADAEVTPTEQDCPEGIICEVCAPFKAMEVMKVSDFGYIKKENYIKMDAGEVIGFYHSRRGHNYECKAVSE